MDPFFVQTLASQTSAGTLQNTFTTAKSVINPQDLVGIPLNFFSKVGRKLRVKAWGGLSNIVTTPGTVTFQVMLGAIAVYSTGAIAMTSTANTLTPFKFEATLRLDSIGSGTAAKFIGEGFLSALNLNIGTLTQSTTTDAAIVVPVAAPAVGTGFDSTIANTLDFFVGFSISNAGNGVQLYDYTVELLN